MKIPKVCVSTAEGFEIIEEMRRRGYSWCIEQCVTMEKPTVWFIPPHDCIGGLTVVEDVEAISEKADSVPMAICLAAHHANETYGTKEPGE